MNRISPSEIKSIVTVQNVLDRYGVYTEHGRCKCLIHNGEDFNAKIYPDAIRCFVCNKTADIFEIVQILFRINFSDAVKLIKSDFRISDEIDTSEIKKRKIELQRARTERDNLIQQYDLVKFCIDNLRPGCPMWCWAINKVDLLEYKLGLI